MWYNLVTEDSAGISRLYVTMQDRLTHSLTDPTAERSEGLETQLRDAQLHIQALTLELNLHKDALVEQLAELRNKSQIISAQNGLLASSWSQSQAMAMGRAEQDSRVAALEAQIARLSSFRYQQVCNRLKRKLYS